MEIVKSLFLENKNSIQNEINSGDSYQALTNFSFSEIIFLDFCQNKFLKFLMKSNMAKFHELIVVKIWENKFWKTKIN
jgi:hypothetical protein